MKIVIALFCICMGDLLKAQEGYQIQVTLKPFKNQFIYFGNYYGTQLPIIDSVKLDDKSEGVFRGTKKLGSGVYFIGFPDRAHHFDILIDKNQRFSLEADTAHLATRKFSGSAENIEFRDYQTRMDSYGQEMETLLRLRTVAKNVRDSAVSNARIKKLNTLIKEYREQIINKDKAGILSFLLQAMKEPELPPNDPRLKKDSLFSYRFYKAHYWDGSSFYDDRLVRTPFFESRLDKYFETLVYPSADSVNSEMDWMLGYASINEEMQKFLLIKFVNRYLNQKYMWEDAVFVHLFEKYFSQTSYPWLNEKGKKLITDRAYSLMSNIMGNPAPEIDLPDMAGNRTSLYAVTGPYVLVTIWDPQCSHCKEIIPKIDSLYHLRWKAMGVRLFGMGKETDGTQKDWTDFIQSHHLAEWVHVYDSKSEEQQRVNANKPGYAQLYDVQSFPTLYLLDKDKKIIAKKLAYDQVDEILKLRSTIKNNVSQAR